LLNKRSEHIEVAGIEWRILATLVRSGNLGPLIFHHSKISVSKLGRKSTLNAVSCMRIRQPIALDPSSVLTGEINDGF